MTFNQEVKKKALVASLVLVLVGLFSPVYCWAEDFSSGVLAGQIPIVRNFLMRSDVLTKSNAAVLKELAVLGRNPRTGVIYDWRGFPQFDLIVDVTINPLEYGQYGKVCNRKLLEQIRKNKELRKLFTPEDIELLENGQNPRGMHWHHDPERPGHMQLVSQKEHSTRHVGGRKIWDPSDFRKREFLRATALRWGGIAFLDTVFRSALQASRGQLDTGRLTQSVCRSTAGGLAGYMTETLLVNWNIVLASSPPGYICGLPVMWGGPASWAGGLAYLGTAALVDHCWESRYIRQLEIQERVCCKAEMAARWQILMNRYSQNNGSIRQAICQMDFD